MTKKRLSKGIKSLEKEIKKHLEILDEAKERGDVGAMKYLGRELRTFLKEKKKREFSLLPRKKKLKLKRRNKEI